MVCAMPSTAPAAPASLRPARTEDAPQLVALYLASRARFLPYAPLAHPPHEVARWMSGVLLPAGGVLVAPEAPAAGAALLGFVAPALDNGTGWIEQLYLAPGHTGRGLGAALLHAALAQLRQRGCDSVQLWCFAANHGARRFYERHGFVAQETTDGRFNEEGCPDVRYERRFAA